METPSRIPLQRPGVGAQRRDHRRGDGPPLTGRSLSSVADLDRARRALEAVLGPGAVVDDPLERRLYARDASLVEGSAGLLVFPTSADEVAACMTVARDHGLPVVPRGSGTGLAGGATPLEDALVVVTTKMRRILDVRPQDRLAWGEPRVFYLDLATALAPAGVPHAPDPSSQQVSSIGGNINTNAGGPHCLAYGVTSAHVLALDVVLPDGTQARIGAEGPAAAGYDLRGIVVGSEGTLGVVTAVCVRLTPIAPAVHTMLLDFARVEDCAATVSSIVARGVVPAALEMMDRGIVRAVEAFAHAGYPTDAAAVLLVEVDGLEAGVAPRARRGRGLARRGRRARGGRRRAGTRGRGGSTRPRGGHRARGRRRHRACAAVEGAEVRVRRHRPDRTALPPA